MKWALLLLLLMMAVLHDSLLTDRLYVPELYDFHSWITKGTTAATQLSLGMVTLGTRLPCWRKHSCHGRPPVGVLIEVLVDS